jgi:acetyl esterase/lipase
MTAPARLRLHPQARAVVGELYASGAHPRHVMSPAQARQALLRLPSPPGPPAGTVTGKNVRTRSGRVAVRVYTPLEPPLGTLLYLHGGGWVLGTLDGSDALCRSLATLAGCNVVSLGYRLAPEFPFPAALEDTQDCLSALGAGEVIEPGRLGPIAVGGMSAGGNLAAVACRLAREQGGPALAHQLLIVPVCDCDLDRGSYHENAAGLGLEREEMRWFWSHYLPDLAARQSPLACPLRAESLAGLPPAAVVVAGCDPLRDEGLTYARQLHDAGVEVVCTLWAGMHHGFFGNARIDAGAMALSAAAEGVRRAFQRAHWPAGR